MRQSQIGATARFFAELPEFDPPPELWSRIVAQRRTTLRRQRSILGTALAASIALAAVLLVHSVSPPVVSELAMLQAQSQRLEARLGELEREVTRPVAVLPADLRSIEQTLQRAYDRAASDAELAPLWQQRNDLLHALIALHEQDARVTRI